jgi:hypothetical protein
MAERLCSVDELKSYLRIPAAETALNTELGIIVEEVSDQCAKFCGRTFTENDFADEKHPGGSDVAVLKNWPVDSASAFTVEETDGITPVTVLATNYDVNYSAGIVKLRSGKFRSGPGAVLVSYTAGYAETAGTGTAAKVDVPASLSRSIRELAAATYRKQQGALGLEELEKERTYAKRIWSGYSRMGW